VEGRHSQKRGQDEKEKRKNNEGRVETIVDEPEIKLIFAGKEWGKKTGEFGKPGQNRAKKGQKEKKTVSL